MNEEITSRVYVTAQMCRRTEEEVRHFEGALKRARPNIDTGPPVLRVFRETVAYLVAFYDTLGIRYGGPTPILTLGFLLCYGWRTINTEKKSQLLRKS